MLVDGRWTRDWDPYQKNDAKGRFVRQRSSFRSWITPDGSPGPTGEGGFPAEPGRYRLYIAWICPWASRTTLVRALRGLQDQIAITVLDPRLGEQGWTFGPEGDPLSSAEHLHELYTRVEPAFTGRATVPVLWDETRQTIVNNESADIMRMLATAFPAGPQAVPGLELYPEALADEMARFDTELYEAVNNGVYRAGFARSQEAYEEAVQRLFAALDELEARLEDGRPFLFGAAMTGSDVRLFVTLIRFDAVYYSLFKCNLRRIADYPRLQALMERVYALPGAASTVNLEHIKAGYYSVAALNPTGIVPVGPRGVLGDSSPG
ncbi:glutathione S-transferase C-terminal domain-containing protein [Pseudenhygromyxa sp. WMMC2535]|uniref:glutathione S-transferase family protein n=1 Tax=Pseudenhygromyxa sp. WMMC2535 TaxID=2712867 RepID=UPI001556D01F|nr:glutathione S-transferase C-terminal domain-containing protein [Pseudenhygromyxa sp. WMMC2535]NVB39132.1 glutathione S-transferase C-terminal domain-containing protein [Pseudenhygromyxa sp. WMMC2535]